VKINLLGTQSQNWKNCQGFTQIFFFSNGPHLLPSKLQMLTSPHPTCSLPLPHDAHFLLTCFESQAFFMSVPITGHKFRYRPVLLGCHGQEI
jgi:hypothetical protein